HAGQPARPERDGDLARHVRAARSRSRAPSVTTDVVRRRRPARAPGGRGRRRSRPSPPPVGDGGRGVSIDRATGEPPVAPALEASAAAPAETVGVRPILHPGRNCWVVAEAADSGVLIDGEEYYRAFHDAA